MTDQTTDLEPLCTGRAVLIDNGVCIELMRRAKNPEFIVSGAVLLIRPGKMMPDESGEHPGEMFQFVEIPLDRLEEIVQWVREDWQSQQLHAPLPIPADNDSDASASQEASQPETYDRPPHGWTCFHCGETFTTVGCAADHFGDTPAATPGCLLKVSLGHERGLLMALRRAEQQLALHLAKDPEVEPHISAMQARHVLQLEEVEEAGYQRGLRAGKATADRTELNDVAAQVKP